MPPPRRWASATCPRWRRRRGSACLQREVRCGELTTWGGLSAREAGEAGKSESIHASLGSGDKIEQGEIWLPFRHLSDSTLRTIGLSKPWTGRFSNDPGRLKSPALKWCLREKTRVWPPRYPPPQKNWGPGHEVRSPRLGLAQAGRPSRVFGPDPLRKLCTALPRRRGALMVP